MPDLHESRGVVSITSPYSLEATLAKLKQAIADKGLTLFADIDHAAGAREAALQMQEAHVLVFGHPKAGTPVMVARPLAALDLPLKILVWQDGGGAVQASFSAPEFIAERHAFPPELLKNIAGVEPLVKAALA
jgi:uncharacterized protein (DUF302 family)